MITFHTPLSTSTPHTYISTGPFLPSQSPLSTIFSKWFTKTIKMQRGRLLSWPAPPMQWIGHTDSITSISCSPNGYHIVSGSNDMTIRIWDVETGAGVGSPLKGHTGYVKSVAYSPDGRHIISGSGDMTIRVWDAETGAPVGRPLEGHYGTVSSVAYSPNGQHIISGSTRQDHSNLGC
jgi:WD40 repeat protein